MNAASRREYEELLRRVLFTAGSIVERNPGVGWTDHPATEHMLNCDPYSADEVQPESWYEFVSMGDPESGRTDGLVLRNVHCVCGWLVDRELRWSGDLYELGRVVYEQARAGRR